MEVLHYNLDMTPESEWKIVSAGPFARDNLLYLQEDSSTNHQQKLLNYPEPLLHIR